MSISGSLANALSGLNAAARAAEVVSSNVANATTAGYGRRQLEQSSVSLDGSGAGVRVNGVARIVDLTVIGDRRLADAQLGASNVAANFYGALASALGTPDDPNSLTANVSELQGSLVEASGSPDSQARLAAVASAATRLANHISTASDNVQSLRMEADRKIASQVGLANDALGKIATLNKEIRAQIGPGRDVTALMDQRQILVDKIAGIVPIHEVARDHGQIALFTTGGAILLDGRPAQLSFTPVNAVTAQMTQASGALSGLTIDGQTVRTDASNGPISGGSLAALFHLRDGLAVEAQGQLDAIARDLVDRFADPAVDPTLAPGDAGLFTDAGAAFNPANETGLSGRLKLNALVDPAQGGALWRLRAGLGATARGDAGDATRLNAYSDTLARARTPATGPFAGTARSAAALAADLVSRVSQAGQSADADRSFASARDGSLKTQELRTGVNTDQEMQHLLVIEKAYGANAKVIQIVDGLLKTLLGI